MEPGDIDCVMAIAARLPDAPHWPRSVYEAVFAPDSSPQRIALVAETSASSPAGFLIAALIPPQADLELIAVAPLFQRQGIARRLLRSLAGELQARHCSEILLEVRSSNIAARGLYAASGFAETTRRPAYYSDPVEDAILMSRPVK
jgi:ribosomal-protein-alanine N-acetyltransferase